jgi:hypothetical protein
VVKSLARINTQSGWYSTRLVFAGLFGYTAHVRKRLVIGALAAIVIGFAAYVLSQPKEGTVEWHKRRYEKEMHRIDGKGTLFDRIRSEFGLPSRPSRHMEHRQALIDLGYLEERQIILTNNPEGFSAALIQWATNELPRDRLWAFGVRSNVMFIRAERHNMKKWEEAVRRIDVSRRSETK